MQKRYPADLLVMCAVLGVAVGVIIGYSLSERARRGDNSDSNKRIETLQSERTQRDQEIADANRSTALLAALASDREKHRALFDLLDTIDRDELRCVARDLTGHPLKMYVFHRSHELADGSPRPIFERKSALVLVNSETGDVIDSITGDGFRSEGYADGSPWTTQWEKPDGSSVEYQILATGFQQVSQPE